MIDAPEKQLKITKNRICDYMRNITLISNIFF